MRLEKLEYPEKYMVKMTFVADAAELEAVSQAVYERTRGSYTVKGYERGEADRAAIEAEKGEHVFWYDAINDVMDEQVQGLIDAAAAEHNFDFSTEPAYDLVSVTKEDGFVTTATIALHPEMTLGVHSGFTAKCVPIPVDETDIDRQVERARSANVELVPHKGPAVKGNVVICDYEGRCEGKVFQGGTAQNAEISIGARRMIPGFEEGLIGHAAGDEFDMDVTFPEHYGEKRLAGKAAVFHIKIHSVNLRQIPALNADFAKKVGKVDTMEEYRAQIRARMEGARKRSAMDMARNNLLDMLGKECTGELPTMLVDVTLRKRMDQFRMQLQMMHMTLGQFLQQTRRTKEEFDATMRERAEAELRVGYALKLLAKAEGVVPTEEEYQAELADRAKKADKTVEEYSQTEFGKALRGDMINRNARTWFFDHCTIEE